MMHGPKKKSWSPHHYKLLSVTLHAIAIICFQSLRQVDLHIKQLLQQTDAGVERSILILLCMHQIGVSRVRHTAFCPCVSKPAIV